MQMHEDLATLFSRNLSLQNAPYSEPTASNPTHQTTQPEEAITYSITQHYHHSAHLASQTSKQASSPVPTDRVTTEIILGRHGVDVTTLFPSQIELFQTAEPSQQMRLVELWRISPPTYGGHALAQWPSTSYEQEEAMAKLREAQKIHDGQHFQGQVTEYQQQQHLDGNEDMMSDGEQSNAPLTPIQSGDGRWLGSTQLSSHPEPYMASGYESLAAREYELSAKSRPKDIYTHFGTAVGGPSYSQATDPVYNAVANIQQHSDINDGWAKRSQEEQQRAMEDQYGTFTQHHYSPGVAVGGYGGEDEEML